MKREEIQSFNYRAMVILAQKNKKVGNSIKALGYDVNDGLLKFNNEYSQSYSAKFKQALLKVYRQYFEETTDEKLLTELKKLYVDYPIIQGRNFKQEIRDLEGDMGNEIQTRLKVLNKTFSRDDDEPLEFLTFDTTSDIKEIYPDGTAKVDDLENPMCIKRLIDCGEIHSYDAATLVENLRVLK